MIIPTTKTNAWKERYQDSKSSLLAYSLLYLPDFLEGLDNYWEGGAGGGEMLCKLDFSFV